MNALYKKYIHLVFLALFACGESTVELSTDRLGYHYFPLDVGDFRIYDVEESRFTVLGEEQLSYELKEYVADSGLNASDNLYYILHRSTRINDTDSWNLDSIWTAQKTTSIGILFENNRPFVKMSFPDAQGIFWDGNSMNTNGNETYQYELDIADTILFDTPFEKIVKVVQNDRSDAIGVNDRAEFFAPNVGLILKTSTVLNYCQADCKEINEIQSGRTYKMTLKSYGKE